MSYKQINRLAFAGQIGKVGESLARSTGEQNVGATVVSAGYFVAMATGFGIKALSAITDSVAGVVVKSQLQDSYAKDEYLSVGKIGHGDSMWVVAEGTVARGNAVHIRAVAGVDLPAGSVSAAKIEDLTDPENPVTLSIESDLIVINVADGLAEVTRKE